MEEDRFLDPSALSMLSRVMAQHCDSHGIAQPEARESVALSVLAFYRAGVRGQRDLLRLLEEQDRPHGMDKPPPVKAIRSPA